MTLHLSLKLQSLSGEVIIFVQMYVAEFSHLCTPHPEHFRRRGLPFSLALCLGAMLGVCMPTIGI